MNYVVDDMGTVVAAMRAVDSLVPFYMYGHRLEISNRLLEKTKDKVLKYQKYPLVALRMDIPETVKDGLWHYKLNIVIVAKTDPNYDTPERMQNVFRPVLYPLYEQLLQAIINSGLFMWEQGNDVPVHTKIDRPFWGITAKEGNTAYIFNDPLDGIEIIDLELTQRIKCS